MSNQVILETSLPNGVDLQLVQGDITQEAVDAIVNAANEHLQHGGGVAAAIAQAGGHVIQEQSNQWIKEHGPIGHDQAAVTEGGKLASRYVIHVVGPRWGEGNEAAKLRRAVQAALMAAEANECSELALPAISTGIFGYPLDQAADEILSAICTFIEADLIGSLERIRIVLFDQFSVDAFRAAMKRLQEFE